MLPINKEFEEDYKKLYYSCIEEYVKRRRTLLQLPLIEAAIQKYFSPHLSSFRDLILASPEKLEKIIELYEEKPIFIRKVINIVLDMNSLYNAFTTDKLKKINRKKVNSEYHYKKLKFENCPYCNENKIVSWSRKKGGVLRSYDWDHFIPKKAYPFVAISLYNLIPSCKVCNFLKKDTKKIGLNPYYKYSIDELLTFSIRADDLKYYDNIDLFSIRSSFEKNDNGEKLRKLLSSIHLVERYSESKEMLRFLFRKHKSYSKSVLNSFEKKYGKLSEQGKREFFEMFFNVYTNENEYKHMPYSKLISDILYDKNTH